MRQASPSATTPAASWLFLSFSVVIYIGLMSLIVKHRLRAHSYHRSGGGILPSTEAKSGTARFTTVNSAGSSHLYHPAPGPVPQGHKKTPSVHAQNAGEGVRHDPQRKQGHCRHTRGRCDPPGRAEPSLDVPNPDQADPADRDGVAEPLPAAGSENICPKVLLCTMFFKPLASLHTSLHLLGLSIAL